ncbi:hypothetical protein [Streptomyces sp. NPDC093109]|uniref:hypothetical protein n=1 Tax=Streptomyces sp. NPDC093109 TaxID=3154977 RepID=UPI00344EF8C4
MSIHPNRQKSGRHWWPALSLACAGVGAAALLYSRFLGTASSRAGSRPGSGHRSMNDTASHLTTSW